MNKRIEKRHKRQVERAKAKVKLSEPDVRTPEQIQAAKEASKPDASRGNQLPAMRNSSRSLRSSAVTSTGSSAKTGA